MLVNGYLSSQSSAFGTQQHASQTLLHAAASRTSCMVRVPLHPTNLSKVWRILRNHPQRASSTGQRYARSHRRQDQVDQQLLASQLHDGNSAVVWTICARGQPDRMPFMIMFITEHNKSARDTQAVTHRRTW